MSTEEEQENEQEKKKKRLTKGKRNSQKNLKEARAEKVVENQEVTILPFIEACNCGEEGNLDTAAWEVAYRRTISDVEVAIFKREEDDSWSDSRLKVVHEELEKPTFAQIIVIDGSAAGSNALILLEFGGLESGTSGVKGKQQLVSFSCSNGTVNKVEKLESGCNARHAYHDEFSRSVWIPWIEGIKGCFKKYRPKTLEKLEDWENTEVRRPRGLTTNARLLAVDEDKQYVIVFNRKSNKVVFGVDFRAWAIALTPDDTLVTLGTDCLVTWEDRNGEGHAVHDSKFPQIMEGSGEESGNNYSVTFQLAQRNHVFVREVRIGQFYAVYSLQLLLDRQKTSNQKYKISNKDVMTTRQLEDMVPITNPKNQLIDEPKKAEDPKKNNDGEENTETRNDNENNEIAKTDESAAAEKPKRVIPDRVDGTVRCKCF